MENKNQKARDNVVQVQADTINIGLTEETVRNIISIETQKALKEAELVATEVALKRLNEYNETLINKLVKYEMLQAFSFQPFKCYLEKQKELLFVQIENLIMKC